MLPQDNGTILVVDDEPVVRGLISKILRADGYRTMEAADGLAAYSLVRRYHDSLSLVVTDVQMPRMNGADLADRLQTEFPAIQVLLVSGFSEPQWTGRRFLLKPFTSNSLRTTVREIIETPRPAPLPQPPAATPLRSVSDLRLRLAAAHAKLEAANREYRTLAEEAHDALDSPADGRLALHQAKAARQAAYDEYTKSLRDCTELLSMMSRTRRP